MFHEALDRPSDQWQEFVDSFHDAGDATRSEVLALLMAGEPSGPCILDDVEGLSDDEESAQEPPLESGTAVGQFTIRGLLGSGGMGVVYRVEQVMHEQEGHKQSREAALKLIRAGKLRAGLERRLKREALVLSKLNHPGIAHVYEAGMAVVAGQEQPYIAMELVSGQPLMDFVKGTNPSLEATITLMIKVCDAVEHAHQKGVIHRDLKPANILVVEPDVVKVLDFGVARLLVDDLGHDETRAGQLIGTLAYMSPEQMRGSAAEPDIRIDVYALGVMLYEVLARKRPIEVHGLPLAVAAHEIANTQPAPLGTINRRLRGDLSMIAAKALEKEPSRRYQSVGELRADLESHLQRRPISARADSAAHVVCRLIQRHPAVSALTLLLVMAAIAWGGREYLAAHERQRIADRATSMLLLLQMSLPADPYRPEDSVVLPEDVDQLAKELLRTHDNDYELGIFLRELGRLFDNKASIDNAPEYHLPARNITRMAVGVLRAVPEQDEDTLKDLAEALNYYAWACSRSGALEDAVKASQEAAEIRIRLHGATHDQALAARADAARMKILADRPGAEDEFIAVLADAMVVKDDTGEVRTRTPWELKQQFALLVPFLASDWSAGNTAAGKGRVLSFIAPLLDRERVPRLAGRVPWSLVQCGQYLCERGTDRAKPVDQLPGWMRPMLVPAGLAMAAAAVDIAEDHLALGDPQRRTTRAKYEQLVAEYGPQANEQ